MFWEANLSLVSQLGSGRAWIWTQAVWLQTLMTTKPHCLPSHSWCRSPDVVPGRWEDHRVPFSRIIVDGKSLPGMPKNSPSLHTTTTCNLWTIIKSNSSMGTMWEKLRQLKPPWGPEASFLLVWTNPVSAFQKEHLNQAEKKSVVFFF